MLTQVAIQFFQFLRLTKVEETILDLIKSYKFGKYVWKFTTTHKVNKQYEMINIDITWMENYLVELSVKIHT